MFTLSGTTLSLWEALGKIALTAGWVTLQLWAVGAVALAISACTEHPMVVVVSVLAGNIVFSVLNLLDAVSWLHPFLLNKSWDAITATCCASRCRSTSSARARCVPSATSRSRCRWPTRGSPPGTADHSAIVSRQRETHAFRPVSAVRAGSVVASSGCGAQPSGGSTPSRAG